MTRGHGAGMSWSRYATSSHDLTLMRRDCLPLAVPIATIAHVELCGRRGEWRLLRRPLFSVLTLEQSLPRGRGPSVSDDGIGGSGSVGASGRRHFPLRHLSS